MTSIAEIRKSALAAEAEALDKAQDAITELKALKKERTALFKSCQQHNSNIPNAQDDPEAYNQWSRERKTLESELWTLDRKLQAQRHVVREHAEVVARAVKRIDW